MSHKVEEKKTYGMAAGWPPLLLHRCRNTIGEKNALDPMPSPAEAGSGIVPVLWVII